MLHTLLLLISASAVISWYPNNWRPEHHGYHGVHDGWEHADSFVDEWTVEVTGGEQVAQLIALELGYIYGGKVAGFPNKYNFLKFEHGKQRRNPGMHTLPLAKDKRVKWAEQVFVKSRVKRSPPQNDFDQTLHRVKRVEQSTSAAETRRGSRRRQLFNDELWSHEWYLQDTRTTPNLPRLDLNVLPVYMLGVNGNNVRISVLDDGIEHNHTDLRDNYDPEISWDCNDQDSDPSPRPEELKVNSHGTRCAGEIAMTANNKKCGVGVAWGAKVGGIRMLDGRITDRIEGEAIGYAWDKVDIYSASWGPNDDGKTVEGPGRLAKEAFARGVTKGRGGKGCIYVWANGNGGGNKDNCNCDGYSSSIYTVSIGSASQHGLFPWYGEVCTSTLATAYSSGAYKDQKIATTDTNDSCTLGHTGTSAAAPLAAGIIALALHANPNLTWRDVQHLIVWTSEYAPLSTNPGWQINGVGLRFDTRFGFGLMNAGALVMSALNWTTVPEKQTCRIEAAPSKENAQIFSKDPVEIIIEVDESTRNCKINFLEHVELVINARYTKRGALEVYLLSPQGTNVQLLSPRPKDKSTAGFVNWPLMSVATWGEDPKGIWRVLIEDNTNDDSKGEIGLTTLILHGTAEIPEHMKQGTRKYNYDYNNYQKAFDYYDKDGLKVDNIVAERPEEHNREDSNIIDYEDSNLINKVEEELQRIHHRYTRHYENFMKYI